MSEWPKDPNELSEEQHEGIYRTAGAIWSGQVEVAKRKRDRALVLVREVSDGDWVGNIATDGRRWIHKRSPDDRYGAHYEIVMELDAPRRAP